MTKQDLQFHLDQLRKDKIIYATEATAVNLVCLVGMLAASVLLAGRPFTQMAAFVVLVLIAMGYTIYMGVGNYRRLQTIKKLEKKVL